MGKLTAREIGLRCSPGGSLGGVHYGANRAVPCASIRREGFFCFVSRGSSGMLSIPLQRSLAMHLSLPESTLSGKNGCWVGGWVTGLVRAPDSMLFECLFFSGTGSSLLPHPSTSSNLRIIRPFTLVSPSSSQPSSIC